MQETRRSQTVLGVGVITTYIPATPLWFTATCPIPGCNAPIRAAKRENLARVVHRHVTMVHPGETDTDTPPDVDPSLPATHKRIAIVSVHFSGSRKRLGAQFRDLMTAIVPSAFPGESGVAVVRFDGRVVVYSRLGAGAIGFEMVI